MSAHESDQGPSQDGEARSGRRSRGRGRGRGRGEESGTANATPADSIAAPPGTPIADATETPHRAVTGADAAPPRLPAVEQLPPLAAAEPGAVTPIESVTANLAQDGDSVPIASPIRDVVSADQGPAASVPATSPVTDPIIIPAVPVAAEVDISGSLEQAGLVMIETSSVPAHPVAAPAPVLGRKPRPAPTLANEPLQMVETKSS